QLPFLTPHPHFPPPAARRPVLPVKACGHRPDGIEDGSPDRLTQASSRKRRILHLDTLQRRPAKGKLRQVQAAQVPAQLVQQRQQVRRSIALGVICPCAQLAQQRQQVLLHCGSLQVDTLHLGEQRSHDEPLLGLPPVVLGILLV